MNRILLPILAFLLANAALVAQSKMVDPFFLIEYDPQEIHFETMPRSLEAQCPAIWRRYNRAWVYAHVKAEDGEYYILYGYVKAPRAEGGEVLEEGDGMAVALRGATCLTDQTDYFLRQEINPALAATPIKTSNAVLVRLSQDMLQRYVKAFGGKAVFLRNVDSKATEDMPQVLKGQFEDFKRMP